MGAVEVNTGRIADVINTFGCNGPAFRNALAGSFKPVLDLRKRETGWLMQENRERNRVFLMHKTRDAAAVFTGDNPKSWSNFLETACRAQAYAIQERAEC